MRTGGGATGKVESINKNSAVILMGIMRMTVKLRDLQHANEPLEIKSKSVQMDTVAKNSKFESRIDIRGMRMEEALRVVEEFMDNALISSASDLQIVHGKGSGALRQAVKMKLKEYKNVKEEIFPKYPHMQTEIETFVNHMQYSIKMASVLIALITLFGAVLMYFR